MERLKEFLGQLVGGAFGTLFMIAFMAIPLGDLYWLWLSIQWGSFLMFVLGFVPPLIVVTGPVGLWAFTFGVPDWLFTAFN